MKIFSLKSLVIACGVLALIGCGDSKTTIVEIAPTPVDNGEVTPLEALGKGRLAIAEEGEAVIHIFDLEDNSLVESLNITNPAEYLYASPKNRYAVAVQRSHDTVEFIDGGVWKELHGDHYDLHTDTPTLTSFTLHDVKPTHFVPRGEQAAVFFDGNKDTGVNAGLSLLSDESIGEERIIAEHHFDTYMHGTAEIRGEHVLTTIRDSESESSLPEQVVVLEVHGDHFHQEQAFATSCPALHGSFQTEDYIAFACGDGVLAIEQQGNTFTEHKISNPVDMPAGTRIGTLLGSEESHIMIGRAGSDFFLIDLIARNISSFNWQQEEGLTRVSYGFDGHNEHMLILDNQGYLNLYSAESDWQFESRINVFDNLTEEASPVIVPSKADELIYIINGQEVTTVDLHEGVVVGHLELDFVPGKAAWLGIAIEEAHDH